MKKYLKSDLKILSVMVLCIALYFLSDDGNWQCLTEVQRVSADVRPGNVTAVLRNGVYFSVSFVRTGSERIEGI